MDKDLENDIMESLHLGNIKRALGISNSEAGWSDVYMEIGRLLERLNSK